MAPSLVLFFLLLITAATSPSAAPETSTLTIPSSPPPESQPLHLRRGGPLPSQSPPPPSEAAPPPETETSDEQLNHIIDALIGAGDFGNWASVISGAVLPLSATLFVPENEAVPAVTVAAAAAGGSDPFMLPYHVVPQRLTFAELLAIRTGARLPTLLPGKTVVVTDNSPQGFAIDGSRVTAPDLYFTATFTVHGVARVFDYAAYGDELVEVLPNLGPTPPDSSDGSQPGETPAGKGPHGVSSGAAPPCLCAEIPAKLLAVCVVLGFKIHWNSFRSKA